MPNLFDNCPPFIVSEPPAGSVAARGEGNLFSGQIPYFHELLGQWPTGIPLKTMWQVWIVPQNESYFKSELSKVGQYEPGNDWAIETGFGEVWHESTQSTVGCTYAQGIAGPSENIGVDHAGIPGGNQGFINGPIANNRANFAELEISFIETNSSFMDLCIRPWTIMTGHKGFFAYPIQQSIKATIYLFFMAKAGSDRNATLRKTMTFNDCLPVAVDSEGYTYGSDDISFRQAKFVYNSYEVSDGTNYGAYRPSRNEHHPR